MIKFFTSLFLQDYFFLENETVMQKTNPPIVINRMFFYLPRHMKDRTGNISLKKYFWTLLVRYVNCFIIHQGILETSHMMWTAALWSKDYLSPCQRWGKRPREIKVESQVFASKLIHSFIHSALATCLLSSWALLYGDYGMQGIEDTGKEDSTSK